MKSTGSRGGRVGAARGSGNVFADLGLSNPAERLAKAQLAHRICVLIEDSGLKQVEVAKVLGVDQPKVSALVRGRLEGFSLGRLMEFLVLLGEDVVISTRPKGRGKVAKIVVESGVRVGAVA